MAAFRSVAAVSMLMFSASSPARAIVGCRMMGTAAALMASVSR
jgi:hypothetical protein